jgi:hypothetical protein
VTVKEATFISNRKMSFFPFLVFSSTKSEKRRAEQVLSGRESCQLAPVGRDRWHGKGMG